MLVVLTAAVALGGVGCKKKVKNPTQIPGGIYADKNDKADGNQQPPVVTGGNTIARTNPTQDYVVPSIPVNGDGSIAPTDGYDRSKFTEDRSFFKANTVFFDYDRAAVRAGERIRVEEVAAYLKGKPGHMVEIEGHCDERGTEEYNRALGERRALAVREYLVNLGVQPERVHTISFGEDRPAEIGSSEGAWAKNRRGEFILLTPRQ